MKNFLLALALIYFLGVLYLLISDMYKNMVLLPKLFLKIIYGFNYTLLIVICIYNIYTRCSPSVNVYLYQYIYAYAYIYLFVFCLMLVYFYKKTNVKQKTLNAIQEQQIAGVTFKSNKIVKRIKILIYVFICFNPIFMKFSKFTIFYTLLLVLKHIKAIYIN